MADVPLLSAAGGGFPSAANPLLYAAHVGKDGATGSDKSVVVRRADAAAVSAHEDVMISYSWARKAFAVKVEDFLQSNLVTVWRDDRFLSAGDNYPMKIADAAQRCSVMVLLVSPEFEKSANCLTELDHAIARKERSAAVIVISCGNVVASDDESDVQGGAGAVIATKSLEYAAFTSANSRLRALANATICLAESDAELMKKLWESVSKQRDMQWRLSKFLGVGNRGRTECSDEIALKEYKIEPPLFEVEQLTIFIDGRSSSQGLTTAFPIGWQFLWRHRSWAGEQRGALVVGRLHSLAWIRFMRNKHTMDRVELILAPGEFISSVTVSTQAGNPRSSPRCCGNECEAIKCFPS
jgi:TIR domain